MSRNIPVVALSVLLMLSMRANAAIQLRLRVEPASQLPAIEPTLRVEAINTGSEAVELPSSVVLQVIPPGAAEPFVAYTSIRGDARVTSFVGAGSSIRLAAGETRDISFWAGPESPRWFASDSRLLSPGTYRFQLVSHPKLDSNALTNVDRAVDQPGVTDPLVSNEATYTVETPAGDDAVVWVWIKQLPTPTLWRDSLGHQIWEQRPNSRYAAFSLRDQNTPDLSLVVTAYEAALAKEPTASWADWWRLGIANAEVRRTLRFVAAKDLEAAVAANDRVKTIVTDLAAKSPNPYLRSEAQRILDTNVVTRSELLDRIKRLNGEIREVRPFVACVESVEGGKHRFWFGYDSTAREPLSVPIGKENKFTPPPFDRGQPTTFPIYKVTLGLQIVTDEPALTWHLQNSNVHASVAQTQPCPADLRQRFEYEPPQRN